MIVELNGVQVYPFQTFEELLAYVQARKGILVAINAEKILHATQQTKEIINRNIGYCDGYGAVMALRKLGVDAVKIPGCELWLKIIQEWNKEGRSFYLVGSRSEVIEETVAKLRKDYPQIVIAGYRDGYIRSEQERELLLSDIEGATICVNDNTGTRFCGNNLITAQGCTLQYCYFSCRTSNSYTLRQSCGSATYRHLSASL
jgi:UDP-N-acetyl-D-mannosaminouronate:lipid I N-acetyl-D-mannosaminouronosyltransferase